MKLFSCQSCQQIVFFESVSCTKCGHALAFAPDRALMCALEPGAAAGTWMVVGDDAGDSASYRQCKNQIDQGVCNWLIPGSEGGDYCRACRLNHIIPNLGATETKQAWARLEGAKRRVLYTLFELRLPVESRVERPDGGLEFEFLEDAGAPDGPHVYTGHNDGIITINIAEADDPFRERVRVQMGEPYRTVLGHFRHEIGHYYWDRLIQGSPRVEDFRELFGDDRADYGAAQQRHYASGPPSDWPLRFVSAYASMHPWEDWAECWAHYLHIVDTLETARAFSMSLRPVKEEVPRASDLALASRRLDLHSFDDLIAGWIPLTVALNALNRSMGLSDGYPFVLSEMAVRKLRFVHDTIEGQGGGGTDGQFGNATGP